ncbi:MAG: sensor histidine kinase, partial [Clostridiales bacterium]|nr:sensor histidine kinase [Clostridiales bacterium]
RLTPLLTLRADTAMLAKAVENVLSNAALYSPAGALVQVQTRLEGAQAVLTVENTGVQIGDAALPHLFDAFYREEQSRNRKSGGSGLGLYLVRMILEQHGASCQIENVADGVRFTARFPR